MKKVILFCLALSLIACVPKQSFKPIDRSESEYRNYHGIFSFELPQGKDWYEIKSSVFGKKLKTEGQSFIASVTVGKVKRDFNTPKEFLSFFKKIRNKQNDPNKFKIIKNTEVLNTKFGNYCSKYEQIAEEYGKGILKIKGYTCLHPQNSQNFISIQYSERSKSGDISSDVIAEGERFIESLKINKI